MTTRPTSPFSLCFDDDVQTQDSLPEDFRQFYGSDWHMRRMAERPYVYSNFVLARDGRVSFNEAGHLGGGDVSGFNAHDQWLMGLLRSRADAILVGDNTLRLEPEHIWTAEYIYPGDAEAFRELRKQEGLARYPYQIFLSLGGDFDASATIFQQADMHVIIATTRRGAEQAQALKSAGQLSILSLGEESVDLAELLAVLYRDYGIKNLLCEGGPRVYGSFLAAGLMDDEFLTLAPTLIGQADKPRPSLVEGVAFMPDHHPKSNPVSLRRAGAHLFLRASYTYP